MDLLPAAARALLAAPFVVDGADVLLSPPSHVERAQRAWAPLVRAGLPPLGDGFLRASGRAMGAVSLCAGLGLAAGLAPRACALVLVGLNVPVTLVNHPLWLADDDESRSRAVSGTVRGAALGACLLAAGGRWGGRATR